MKKKILNLILVSEIIFIVDFLCNFCDIATTEWVLYVILFLAWIILNRLLRVPLKRHCIIVSILPALAVIAGAIGYALWSVTSSDLQYVSVDNGKGDLYSNQSVMVIVPHEDDEINIAGNVIEQYRQYGSEVHIVFVTNGDYHRQGDIRMNEAITACERMGVDEDHVIFLGYGDQWSAGPHLYNSEPGQTRISAGGYDRTYGLPTHPAYNDGKLYTIDQFLADMKDMILEHRPDTILCIDYDYHVDHIATSLAFEKVMGEILKETAEYKPTILKAFGYNTAWKAENDFYSVNILSTQDVFGSPYNQTPQIYNWSDRVRLPVAAERLSRSLVKSESYYVLQAHRSQKAGKYAGSVVNGDKVFWHRRTDSLLYTASIEATSGDAARLNDFMLIDSVNVLDMRRLPCDGTWVPLEDDETRTVTVQLEEPVAIYEITLYDNPSPEQNVLNAVITFDNGESFETGPLAQTGSASNFVVEQEAVTAFTITLEETEGKNAGLTEIEAYAQEKDLPYTFIKLMDKQENFVYDYVTAPSGSAEFRLYTFGEELAELSGEAYSVSCDNANCAAEIEDGLLVVDCPVGEACTVSVSCNADPDISDSIYVRNLTAWERMVIDYTQTAEQFEYKTYSNNVIQKTAYYRTLKMIYFSLIG